MKLTPEKALELVKGGMKYQAISDEYGISFSTVSRLLKQVGYTHQRKTYSTAIKAKAVAMYMEGNTSLEKVGIAVGIPTHAVRAAVAAYCKKTGKIFRKNKVAPFICDKTISKEKLMSRLFHAKLLGLDVKDSIRLASELLDMPKEVVEPLYRKCRASYVGDFSFQRRDIKSV